jgi:hypothetical protein
MARSIGGKRELLNDRAAGHTVHFSAEDAPQLYSLAYLGWGNMVFGIAPRRPSFATSAPHDAPDDITFSCWILLQLARSATLTSEQKREIAVSFEQAARTAKFTHGVVVDGQPKLVEFVSFFSVPDIQHINRIERIWKKLPHEAMKKSHEKDAHSVAATISDAKYEVRNQDWSIIKECLENYLVGFAPEALLRDNRTYQQLNNIGKAFELSKIELELLQFIYLFDFFESLNIIGNLLYQEQAIFKNIANKCLLSADESVGPAIIQAAFAKLYSLALIEHAPEDRRQVFRPIIGQFIKGEIQNFLTELAKQGPNAVALNIAYHFLGEATRTPMHRLSAYAHLNETIAGIRSNIRVGNPVSLQGPSGAGKTTLVEALLDDMDVTAYWLGSSHIEHGEKAATRVKRIILALSMLKVINQKKEGKKALLVIDEAEDLLTAVINNIISKHELIKLLSDNREIVLIFNDGALPDYLSTRINPYTVAPITGLAQQGIIDNILEANNLREIFSKVNWNDLLVRYAAPARLWQSAITAASVNEDPEKFIREFLRQELFSGIVQTNERVNVPHLFDPKLVCIAQPQIDNFLGFQAKAFDFFRNNPRPSLLFLGPSGTGKTATAQWLGHHYPLGSFYVEVRDPAIDQIILSTFATKHLDDRKLPPLVTADLGTIKFDGSTSAGIILHVLAQLWDSGTPTIVIMTENSATDAFLKNHLSYWHNPIRFGPPTGAVLEGLGLEKVLPIASPTRNIPNLREALAIANMSRHPTPW